MSRLRERAANSTRPLSDEVILYERGERRARVPWVLRTLGAVAVLVVGAVHLEQYVGGYSAVSVIGPLFLLNFVGATVIGAGLLLPAARLRAIHVLLALVGIGLAATSFVFLFISEHRSLFGFQEHGYRGAIVAALVAEAAAVVALMAYLAVHARRRSGG
jgi:hypothetical protein